MSSERYDAMTARQYTTSSGEVKTAWTRLGTMWATAKGFRLQLDALPIPSINDKGVMEVSISMFPPRPKDDAPRGGGGGIDQNDRDIPF